MNTGLSAYLFQMTLDRAELSSHAIALDQLYGDHKRHNRDQCQQVALDRCYKANGRMTNRCRRLERRSATCLANCRAIPSFAMKTAKQSDQSRAKTSRQWWTRDRRSSAKKLVPQTFPDQRIQEVEQERHREQSKLPPDWRKRTNTSRTRCSHRDFRCAASFWFDRKSDRSAYRTCDPRRV